MATLGLTTLLSASRLLASSLLSTLLTAALLTALLLTALLLASGLLSALLLPSGLLTTLLLTTLLLAALLTGLLAVLLTALLLPTLLLSTLLATGLLAVLALLSAVLLTPALLTILLVTALLSATLLTILALLILLAVLLASLLAVLPAILTILLAVLLLAVLPSLILLLAVLSLLAVLLTTLAVAFTPQGFQAVGNLASLIHRIFGAVALTTTGTAFGSLQILQHLFEVAFDYLLALFRLIEVAATDQFIVLFDAVGDAVAANRSGGFAQFVCSLLLILPHAARRLLDILLKSGNLIGKRLLALGELIFLFAVGTLTAARHLFDAALNIILFAHSVFGTLAQLLNVLLPLSLIG